MANKTKPKQVRRSPKGSAKKKKTGGRGKSAFKNPDTIAKLSEAFGIGANVTEACFHAGISRETYYQNTEKYPDIAAKIEGHKHRLALRAKNRIANALLTSTVDAWKYLERRQPETYAPPKRHELSGPDGGPVQHEQFIVNTNFTTIDEKGQKYMREHKVDPDNPNRTQPFVIRYKS